MAEKLTNSFVNKLTAEKTRYWIADAKCPGLTLAVYPSGSKFYYFRYKNKGGRKNNSIKIGNADILSVDEARAGVTSIAGDIAKGIDPKENQQKLLNEEVNQRSKSDLRLFSYIENYYKPYAEEHTVTADEIISCLKKEFEFIKDKPIDLIDSLDIDNWRKRKNKVTFARIKRIFTYLKACINTAVKHYKLIKNFELQNYYLKRKSTEKVNAPKVRYLSKQEEVELLKVLNARDQELRDQRARYVEWHTKRNSKKKKPVPFKDDDFPDHLTPIIIIAYKTGFDIGDIFDFDWQEHIDFENNQIRKIRNKTQHNQDNPQPVIVPMAPQVRKVLERWGKQNGMRGRVFKSPRTGGRLNNMNDSWEIVKGKAGLEDFRLKDLRHTFGTWLAIGGTPLIVIRDLMGHKNIKTTEIYAHLGPDQKNNAVAAIFS